VDEMILLSLRLIRCFVFESIRKSFATFIVYLTQDVNICNCTQRIWFRLQTKII